MYCYNVDMSKLLKLSKYLVSLRELLMILASLWHIFVIYKSVHRKFHELFQRNICFSNEWHDMTFLIARTDCLSQVAGNTKCVSSAIVLLLSSCVAGRRVAQHWSIYCIMCKWSLHWLTIRPNWHKIFGPRGNRSHTKVDFES